MDETVGLPIWRGRGKRAEIFDYALVDVADIEKFPEILEEGRRWHATDKGYVFTGIEGRKIYLHRLITGVVDAGRGVEVDHRNHEPRDNRRSNLLVTDCRGNQQNVFSRGSTSPYRGVALDRKNNRHPWVARVCTPEGRVTVRFAFERNAARFARSLRLEWMPGTIEREDLAA